MKRLTETIDVQRNPSAGETAVTLVVEAEASSPAYPISAAASQSWGMATDYDYFELFLNGNQSIQVGDAATVNDKTYSVEALRPWPATRLYPDGLTNLLLKKRT